MKSGYSTLLCTTKRSNGTEVVVSHPTAAVMKLARVVAIFAVHNTATRIKMYHASNMTMLCLEDDLLLLSRVRDDGW